MDEIHQNLVIVFSAACIADLVGDRASWGPFEKPTHLYKTHLMNSINLRLKSKEATTNQRSHHEHFHLHFFLDFDLWHSHKPSGLYYCTWYSFFGTDVTIQSFILLTSSNNQMSKFRIPNIYNEIFVLIFFNDPGNTF